MLLYNKVGKWDKKFHDYSFIVFPAAKAYEGFLKQLFLDLNFITKKQYYSKRFRIGRSLNPSLDKNDPEWVYKKLETYCNNKDIATQLWKTWKESRNALFHWFPHEINAISYQESGNKLTMIAEAIEVVYSECKLDVNKTKRISKNN